MFKTNSTAKRIIKNFSQLFLSMLISTIGTFFCYAILGRRMPIDDYALFSSILALVAIISVFVNNIAAGIVANREIAIAPQTSYQILRKFCWIRIIGFIVASIYLCYRISNDYQNSILLGFAAVLLLVQDVFWELFEQVAFGLKITKMSMLLNIVFILTWLLTVIITPKGKETLVVVLFSYSLICLLKTVLYGIWTFKKTNKYVAIEYTVPLKRLFIFSMPYLYNRILGTLTTQLPVLLLKGYTELSETAYYSIGEKFAAPITKLTTVFISAVFPFITKELKDNRLKAAKYISESILFVISFGVCFAVLLCSTSDIWLVKLLGEKYTGATEAFNYQVWFSIILSVDCIISMILSCDYKQKVLSIITTIDVIVALVCVWQGMVAGAKGVAMAKLFAAVLCLIYHLLIVVKLYGNKQILMRLLFSWLLLVGMLSVTLFQSNIVILCLTQVVAVIVCIFLNKNTIKVFLTQITEMMMKE